MLHLGAANHDDLQRSLARPHSKLERPAIMLKYRPLGAWRTRKQMANSRVLPAHSALKRIISLELDSLGLSKRNLDFAD
jgi:hypothetical protein